MYYQVIFLLVLCAICGHTAGNDIWNYGKQGPDVWKDINPNCGGKRQSPINIQTACTIYETFEPFNFTYVHEESLNFTLKNNGHTIIGETNGAGLLLTGGNLNGIFSFVSFHLHWGPNYNTGSEHQM